MSPYLLVAALFLLSKKGQANPFGRPVAPGGSAVTSMAVGKRYTLTLLFRGLGPGMPTPTPDVLAASANVLPSPASAFTVDTHLTHVAQNTDGSWAATITGTYNGGNVLLENNAWQLLQMAAAS